MDAQPINNQTPTPVTPAPEIKPAEIAENPVESPAPLNVPEAQIPEVAEPAETMPTPETPVTPEVDQLSKVAQPVDPNQPDESAAPADTSQPVDDDSAVVADQVATVAAPETAHEAALNKKYFAATEQAIDQLEDKPFEEEEKAEDLQIGYLKDRFGKEIQKSEDK